MKTLKVILILIVILALLSFTYTGLTEYTRNKLIQNWSEAAARRGVNLPEGYLKRNMDRLNYWDLRKLVKLSEIMAGERSVLEFPMAMSKARLALDKTDLGTLFGIFFPS